MLFLFYTNYSGNINDNANFIRYADDITVLISDRSEINSERNCSSTIDDSVIW